MTLWQIAIETSCRQGSLALLRQDCPVRSIGLPADQRTAQSLAPALADLLAELPADRLVPDFISVAIGPGSFTGLRIGITAAKTLAYAVNRPVVPVDTLAAIALRLRQEYPQFTGFDVQLNAYRGQVFWRRERQDGTPIQPTTVADWPAWQSLPPAESMISAGDVWEKNLPPSSSEAFQLAPREYWYPQASSVGQLGWQLFERGQTADALQLKPAYLRASAAEEKRQAENHSTVQRGNSQ